MGKKKIPNELSGAGEIVEDFNTRIIGLEERFGDNEKIAKTLCNVAETQKDFDKIFEKAIINLIKNSSDVKNSFQEFVDGGDRDAFKKLFKRFGAGIIWLVSIVAALYVGYLFRKLGLG